MEERREYQFKNGLKCYQEELTLAQDIEISQILSKHSEGDDSQTNLIRLFSKQGVVEDLLSVILLSENPIEKAKFLTLKNSELQKVIEDFFSLNENLRKLLTGSGIGQATLNMTSMSSSSDKTESSTDTTS